MMNKKVFMCISPVILATLVAAGCSGMKNDDGKKAVQSANAVSTIDANVFLNAEKIRSGKVPPKKDAVKLTPEQQKINGENEKKFSDARLMIWQGKNAEGEKALQACRAVSHDKKAPGGGGGTCFGKQLQNLTKIFFGSKSPEIDKDGMFLKKSKCGASLASEVVGKLAPKLLQRDPAWHHTDRLLDLIAAQCRLYLLGRRYNRLHPF